MKSTVLQASCSYMSFYCFLYQSLCLLKNVTLPMAETAWSFASLLEISYTLKRSVQNKLCGYGVIVAFLVNP